MKPMSTFWTAVAAAVVLVAVLGCVPVSQPSGGGGGGGNPNQ